MGGLGDAAALPGEQQNAAFAASRAQAIEQLTLAEGYFWSLMLRVNHGAGSPENEVPNLGGQLLYAGELDEEGCALAIAGNVAGAASLAATAEPARQQQAVREGVADFLVNSLDEALRILKNEIRRREPVAVCVGREPSEVVREMLERGVRPDLLSGAGSALRGAELQSRETQIIRAEPVAATQAWLAWSVAEAPARWMPKLDAVVLDCLGEEERAARRWLRDAPRYVSRNARGVRVLRCSPQSGHAIVARMGQEVKCGIIGAAAHLALRIGEERVEHEWAPFWIAGFPL